MDNSSDVLGLDATEQVSTDQPHPKSKTKEAAQVLDSDIFEKDLSDFDHETEDEGPEL
ncbi:hypothetical protein RKD55_004687 [Rossellomorea marisflavi]